MRLVFWWNIVSPHQSAYVRNLAQSFEVLIIAQQKMSEQRRNNGWDVPNMGRSTIIIDPSQETLDKVLEAETETLHLLEGLRGSKYASIVIRKKSAKHHVAIITETYNPQGARGIFRVARSWLDARRTSGRIDFVLAMGSAGVSWHKRFNFAQGQVFPFCYVVEYPQNSLFKSPHLSERGDLNILYVGQLIRRKAVHLLIEALAACPMSNWKLSIIGRGPEEIHIRSLASALRIEEKIVFLGQGGHDQIMKYLGYSDLMVLPSYFDGWGAVVNEALMMGTPVICSNMCGASDLLVDPKLGSVFESGSAEDLTSKLIEWIKKGAIQQQERNYIQSFAHKIDGPSIAAYFTDICRHIYGSSAKPLPPWKP